MCIRDRTKKEQRRNTWTNEDGSIRPISKWSGVNFTEQQKADYVDVYKRQHESSSEVISNVYASISLRKVAAGSSPRSMRASSFSHSPVIALSLIHI